MKAFLNTEGIRWRTKPVKLVFEAKLYSAGRGGQIGDISEGLAGWAWD